MTTELERLHEQLLTLENKKSKAKEQANLAKNKVKELEKQRTLLNRKIKSKLNIEERKRRIKRLIEIGSLAEKYAMGEINLEKFENYAKQFNHAFQNLKKD